MKAQVGSWPTSCDPFRWGHGPGVAVSQKCYTNLPKKAGTWTLAATATLTRRGARTLLYRGSKTIKTQGYVTSPVSSATRAQIAKCYNTSKDVWLSFDDGYTSQANLNSILGTLPKLLRPPYGAGAHTARLFNLAASKGYRAVSLER